MVHVLLSLRLYTYILMLFLSLHFEMIIRNNLFFRHHVENTPQWKWIRRKHEALKTCLLASFSSSNTSLSLLQNLWNLITLLLIYKLFKPKNKLNLLCNKVTRSSSANILIGFMFSHVEVQVRREVRVCVCVCVFSPEMSLIPNSRKASSKFHVLHVRIPADPGQLTGARTELLLGGHCMVC